MSEITIVETARISRCHIVHLTVRSLFAINVLLFATSFSRTISTAFMSSYLALPLAQLSTISSFVLPIIAIAEALIFHRGATQNKRSAVIDVVITSLWAIGIFAWVFYALTHFVVL
jgi:hypothetical protein